MPVLLGVAAFLFFGLYYPHHLHFQEQYQLFLLDGDYMADILSVPGGVADLAGRFLTQFFLWAWIGAAIVAILLAGVVALTLKMCHDGWFKGMSLVPAVALWVFYCDENSLLGGIIAVLLAMVAEVGISSIGHRGIRLTIRLLSAPMLYWALGPLAIVSSLLGLITAIRTRDKIELTVSIISLTLMLATPLAAHHWVALPLDRLYLGAHYHRYPQIVTQTLWIAAACTIVVALLPATAPNRWMSITVWTLVIGASGWAIKSSYNEKSEEVMSYDFMARFQQWNRIIDTATLKKPNNALSCTTLNLALGMKGQLADHMFEYNQNGVLGLIPDFERDPVSALPTSEVYYQLGLINTAQRFVFEAQEAILDFQKSGRCYKRLAETNLINGNYEVARKYLEALSKTLFYSTWAKEVMPLLHNEETITNHKEYGRLRSMLSKQDYIFHDRDIAQMLERQVLSNGSNRLAYEYLQSAFLLTGNLDSFIDRLGMASGIQYQQMPNMFQQAYVIWWSRNQKPQDKMPEFISPNTMNGMNQFIAAAQQKPFNRERLKARFGNTYWYYYFVH